MSERFRRSVTDCFSSCTACLGVLLQVERGFLGLCTALQESVHPSITNRESRAARGREQPCPGTLVAKGHHTHGDVGAGIHPGHPAVTRRVLCCPLFLHIVFLSQKTWGFLTKLLSGVTQSYFGSQPNSAILCGQRWLKHQGTPHGAAEGAGDCQNAVREEGKTKNTSGERGCRALQAGSGLQVGAVAVVIFSLHLVVCLSATPTCPAHWREQLGFCSPATDSSETTKITDAAVMEGGHRTARLHRSTRLLPSPLLPEHLRGCVAHD